MEDKPPESPATPEKPKPTQPPSHSKRRFKELWDRISEDSFIAWLAAWFWKEWVAMKEGWVVFLLLWLILATIQFFICQEFVYDPWLAVKDGQIKSDADALNKQKQDDSNALSKSEGARQEVERDRDKYQVMYLNDENTMAPLRQAANEHFFSAPPDKRIDLLLQEIQSLKGEMEAKGSGLQPSGTIVSAVASLTLVVVKDKQATAPGSVMMIGGGVMFGFGNGLNALLIATSQKIESQVVGDNQLQFSIEGEAPVNSPSMGKPIASLVAAKYIEIDLGSFTPAGTIVVGGDITWVINNSIRLSFPIPPQKTVDSRIIVQDVQNELKVLAPTPNTPATTQP
jgi:hypothetical protein